MYELQTLSEFLNNPLGKGTSILPNREVILNDFKRRKKNMEANGKKFPITVYNHKSKNCYYYHVLVPSETARQNTYDVVIEISPPSKITMLNKPSLDKYTAKFFSNCPSFAYTYANVMYSNGMGVESLKKKYPREILTKPPQVRNPTGVIMYEKSLVFAILAIQSDKNMISEIYVKDMAKRNPEKKLLSEVRKFATILEEIEDENDRLRMDDRKSKKEDEEEQKLRVRDVKKLAGIGRSSNKIKAKTSTSTNTQAKGVRKKSKITSAKSSRKS